MTDFVMHSNFLEMHSTATAIILISPKRFYDIQNLFFIFLTKIKLKDNEQCTFYQNDREPLIHLFWTCGISSLFWQGFKQWGINRGELPNISNLTPCLILGLKQNKNESINFNLLIARFFIWTCKMRNISPKIENVSPFLSRYDTTYAIS